MPSPPLSCSAVRSNKEHALLGGPGQMTNWKTAQPLGRRVLRIGRRRFMFLLAGATTAPRALRAQQKTIPVIGFLSGASPGPFAPFVAAFGQGLRETGYVEGHGVAIEYRWAEGRYDGLPDLVADLVHCRVDVIATSGGDTVAAAAKGATLTIPIIFTSGGDPVARGFVASLARPGPPRMSLEGRPGCRLRTGSVFPAVQTGHGNGTSYFVTLDQKHAAPRC